VFRIKRDPAKVLGSAVARSTQTLGAFLVKQLQLLIVVLLVALGVSCRHATKPTVVASVHAWPTPLSTTEFEETGNINMYTEDFLRRSNGARLGYGCQDHASASNVLAMVRSRARRRAKPTDVTDANGTKIGERVMRGTRSDGEIVWTEGNRLFYIDALSLDDALAFEKSNIWRGVDCWDFRSWTGGTEQIVGREPR